MLPHYSFNVLLSSTNLKFENSDELMKIGWSEAHSGVYLEGWVCHQAPLGKWSVLPTAVIKDKLYCDMVAFIHISYMIYATLAHLRYGAGCVMQCVIHVATVILHFLRMSAWNAMWECHLPVTVKLSCRGLPSKPLLEQEQVTSVQVLVTNQNAAQPAIPVVFAALCCCLGGFGWASCSSHHDLPWTERSIRRNIRHAHSPRHASCVLTGTPESRSFIIFKWCDDYEHRQRAKDRDAPKTSCGTTYALQ